MIDIHNNKPVNPNDLSYDQMLENLQGNILKGHGRNFTSHLLIRFYKNNRISALEWIRNFSERVTSCKEQIKETAMYKKHGISGNIFMGFYITGEGYSFINKEDPEKLYIKTMKTADLGDPPVEKWEEGYSEEIHVMILIADDNQEILERETLVIKNEIVKFSDILKIEKGNVIRNDEGEGIEHFGYADGISQPLFFKEEMDEYDNKYENIRNFNPSFPLAQVLVPDFFVDNDNAFGSYFVFRKLEQDVKGFKKQERNIAEKMNLEDDEIVGAAIVGRFEDGTPHALSEKDGIVDHLTNNFNYVQNKPGQCPFLNHIRAVNERDKESRSMIMARRGIPYGIPSEEGEHTYYKEKKGLLFMSFQSSIEKQFEAAQRRANEKSDPIIGQKVPYTAQASCFGRDSETDEVQFQNFVTMKGGEYFFAPSLYYLKNIKIN